eukprot:5774660-Prymnesium_polylepis.1
MDGCAGCWSLGCTPYLSAAFTPIRIPLRHHSRPARPSAETATPLAHPVPQILHADLSIVWGADLRHAPLPRENEKQAGP